MIFLQNFCNKDIFFAYRLIILLLYSFSLFSHNFTMKSSFFAFSGINTSVIFEILLSIDIQNGFIVKMRFKNSKTY